MWGTFVTVALYRPLDYLPSWPRVLGSSLRGLFTQCPAGPRPSGCPGLSCSEVSAQAAWLGSSPWAPCPARGAVVPRLLISALARGKEAEEESLWGGHALVP